MIRLTRFFEIPFDDREISDANLRDFAADHLSRLTANNPGGIFNDIVAATDTKLSAFKGKAASEPTAAAIRIARTAATMQLMDDIKGEWSRREGRIRDAFGKDTSDYLAFYPAGVTEYRQATMDDMPTLLARYAKVSADHSATLGADFVKQWTDYLTKWNAVRGAQVTQKGAASGANDASATARGDLENQLQINVLTIALHHVGETDKAGVYFDQSLLDNPVSPASPPPHSAPTDSVK